LQHLPVSVEVKVLRASIAKSVDRRSRSRREMRNPLRCLVRPQAASAASIAARHPEPRAKCGV